MPLDAKAQNQRAMEAEFVRTLAELALQHQKGTRAFKLSDLQSDEERAIFIAAALEAAPILFSPDSQCYRAMKLNALRGETHAYAEKEAEDIAWQARQDVIKHSDVSRFGVMRPGHCYVCRERVITNKVTLMITENLYAEAHGLCCAKDDARFELIADFAYRVRWKQVEPDACD